MLLWLLDGLVLRQFVDAYAQYWTTAPEPFNFDWRNTGRILAQAVIAFIPAGALMGFVCTCFFGRPQEIRKKVFAFGLLGALSLSGFVGRLLLLGVDHFFIDNAYRDFREMFKTTYFFAFPLIVAGITWDEVARKGRQLEDQP